jgi:hypothetical protein
VRFSAALHYLMRTPHGAALVRRFFPHGASNPGDIERLAGLVMRANNGDDDDEPNDLSDLGDNAETEKVSPMPDRNSELQAIVKRDGGVVGLAKRICKEGPRGVTEHELTALITEHAQQLYPDMSPEHAFTKIYTSPGAEPLRRAVSIAKGLLDIEPVAVSVGGSDTEDDSRKAYDQLQRLAAEQRKRAPFLSVSQAFERASQARPDLLARATRP